MSSSELSSSRSTLRAGTPTRSLPNVLREALADHSAVRLELGEVVAIPDPARVTVAIGGGEVTVPRLASYAPTVGEPCYLLTSSYWTVALGTVSSSPT